jgi:hypothetical protein
MREAKLACTDLDLVSIAQGDPLHGFAIDNRPIAAFCVDQDI